MSKYIISEKALDDINKIWIYTAENWSIEQADRYYNLIFDEIEYIVVNFEIARDFGNIRPNRTLHCFCTNKCSFYNFSIC